MSNSPLFANIGYVTKDRTSLKMGGFRTPRKVLRVHVEVIEAFNSNGTDTLEVGHGTDSDAYATAVDVSTIGIKTVTLGSGVGFDDVERAIQSVYTAGGSAPTTGIALIALEYIPVPPSP